MELTPQLPPLPTLTLDSTQLNVPSEKPPDPSISMLFPENTQYRAPNNPFRGSLFKVRNREHKEALQEALTGIRASFLFSTEKVLEFDGASVGVDTTAEDFTAAVTLVIAAIERGYYSSRDPTPLGPSEWARLSCALLAAVGRGYHRQYSTEKESTLDKIRAEVLDPNPLPKNPTLFHRLAAIADDINTHIGVDQEGYQDWYITLKKDFDLKAARAAAAEVEEKWQEWKASQIDMLAHKSEKEITDMLREKGTDYFIATGQRMGLHFTRDKDAVPIPPTPMAGRKRTSSGSRPRGGSATPTMRKAIPLEICTASPATPRERSIIPLSPARMQLDPPHSPRKATPTPETETKGNLDLATIMEAFKTVLGPAIQSAIAPYAAKITALENATTPKPPNIDNNVSTQQRSRSPPKGVRASIWAPKSPIQAQQPDTEGNDNFTIVTRNERGKKTKGKNTSAYNLTPTPQTNPVPASYAGAAAAAASTKQAPAPPKPLVRIPTITEITVLRDGGFIDTELEEQVRARAADAIVREVTLKMAKAVARPIPLKAGRWSIHPRSKGNFVYSFDGNVPFDLIATYEHILLSPFRGSGKLSPSMGWTRLLAHGVPVWDDNEWMNFGPEALLREVKAMPGLKKAHFAMPPRWLKPLDRITTDYSTITFAISDPDGTITSKLLTGRAALFGKEVVIQRWIDKPALVQCSHCHALGHIRSSRSCPLGRDSVKCHICGGAHLSDKHNQNCTRKHTVAGICDCTHFKCLNCHKVGHTCRNSRCPARDLFRPRPSRGPRRSRGKGKEKEIFTADGPTVVTHPTVTIEDLLDTDGDLYDPPPLPLNPTGPQIRTALHDKRIADIYNNNNQSMEIDSGNTGLLSYDANEFPEALNSEPSEVNQASNAVAGPSNYSPSRLAFGVAQQSLI
jgi:hypothetical protein